MFMIAAGGVACSVIGGGLGKAALSSDDISLLGESARRRNS
jgi:hypothetical protein